MRTRRHGYSQQRVASATKTVPITATTDAKKVITAQAMANANSTQSLLTVLAICLIRMLNGPAVQLSTGHGRLKLPRLTDTATQAINGFRQQQLQSGAANPTTASTDAKKVITVSSTHV